jgi:hypothetical protein
VSDTRSSERAPNLGALVGFVLALAGFMLGSRGLSDNSFLTHLATGRLILDTGSVPSVDPYTFTALGEPWVVQSWLVSVVFAAAEQVAGPVGIRAVVGVLTAALVALAWMLSRACEGVFGRVLVVAAVLGVGAQTWFERPLMVGLVLLAASLLIVERGWSPWWLVPAGWVWANSHGTFPLGIALLVLLAVGARLDRGSWGPEMRYPAFLVAGVLLGVAGPLGPQLLVFPLELLAGSEVLDAVVEWRAPEFESPSQRLFLVQVAAAVALLVRRPSWRAGLPMLVFVTAALLSLRNVAVASIVLVPGMAAAMPPLGKLKSSTVPRSSSLVGAALVAMAVLLGSVRLSQPDYDLDASYPTGALIWAEAVGAGPPRLRTAAPEAVGNLVNLLYGSRGVTFYDDRFDMFPHSVSSAFLELRRAGPGWRQSLDDHGIEAVIWRRQDPLAQVLFSDQEWRPAFVDDGWVVLRHR